MGNQLSRVLRFLTCAVFKNVDWLSSPNQGSRSQSRTKILLFLYFLDTLGPELLSIITKTNTDVENHITCINIQVTVLVFPGSQVYQKWQVLVPFFLFLGNLTLPFPYYLSIWKVEEKRMSARLAVCYW